MFRSRFHSPSSLIARSAFWLATTDIIQTTTNRGPTSTEYHSHTEDDCTSNNDQQSWQEPIIARVSVQHCSIQVVMRPTCAVLPIPSNSSQSCMPGAVPMCTIWVLFVFLLTVALWFFNDTECIVCRHATVWKYHWINKLCDSVISMVANNNLKIKWWNTYVANSG